ncbi:MAG: hypothetical protein ACM3XN_08705 [Chloroflexota bacterium]
MPNGEPRQIALVALGETGRRVLDAVSQSGSGFSKRVLPLTIAGALGPAGRQIVISGPGGQRGAFLVPTQDWVRGAAADYLKLHFSPAQELLGEILAERPRLMLVVGSLADPWAACLIDVALRVRGLRARPRVPLIGIVTLRTGGDQASTQRAMGYAAMKELQYFQDGKLSEADANTVPRRGHGARPSLRGGLFDRVFIVPDPGIDDIPDMDSHAAVASISQEICLAIDGDDALLGEIPPTAAPCGAKRAVFGTLGVARLRFPAAEVRDYCTVRAESALVKRLLSGDHPTQEDRLEDDEFLLSQDIGSPGGTVKLVESLVRNAADAGGIVAGVLTGSRGTGQASAMEQLAVEETELRRHILPQVAEAVRVNAERELARKIGALREWTHYILINRGLNEASAFLKRFESGAVAAIESLERERDDWERRRRDIEERMAACWSEFRAKPALSALFGRGRRVELEAHIRDCHDTLAREEAYDLARKEAGNLLLTGLVEYGGSLQDTLHSISAKLSAIDQVLAGRLAGIVLPEDSSLRVDDLPNLFARFFPGAQPLVERLLGEHDDLINHFAAASEEEIEEALFREGSVDFASNINSLGVFDSLTGTDTSAELDRLLAFARARLATVPDWGSEAITVLTAGVAAGKSAVAAGVVDNPLKRAAEPEIRPWLASVGARHAGGGRNDEIVCSVVRLGLSAGCFAEAQACLADYEDGNPEQLHVFPRYRRLPDLGVSVLKPTRGKRGKKE